MAAFALAPTDPIVGDAVRRLVHLLISPMEALSNEEVVRRVNAFLATDPDLERPPDAPSRAEFERIARV